MAGDNSKPAIPAWQRAQQPQQEQNPDNPNNETASSPSTTDVETPTEPQETSSAGPPLPEASASARLENMRTFLEDAAVKDQPLEKKRAFFESKGIAKDLIDQVLGTDESLPIKPSEFESFIKQQQIQNQQSQTKPTTSPTPTLTTQQQQQQTPPATGPPIITYPEFLIEAHKSPPLITLGRIWNTAQLAAGVSAIIYGASKYLVTPMTASLNEARHDFAQHSQTQLDELNERLGKLVSKQPEFKKDRDLGPDSELDDDETESESSDPTELFHRDVGTQTSPLPSRPQSTFGFADLETDTLSGGKNKKKDPTEYQVTGLNIIRSHLDEMLERSKKLETPNKERQEKMSALRLYLDTLMYASSGIGAWSSGEEFARVQDGNDGAAKDDAIEELKKEIRGVKGVLLSAKRFPGVASRVGGGA